MKNPENVRDLLKLPINYIGFIFYEKSARFVELEASAFGGFDQIGSQGIKKVGVFVNVPISEVLKQYAAFNLDYVQLHGQENVFYCEQLKASGIRIIKAFSVDADFVFTLTEAYQYSCEYFLFDTKGKKPGGNGVQFDWSILNRYQGSTPFFLSGGIGPNDLKTIKKLSFPRLHAVDLNSRFEIQPGQKNIPMLHDFVHELKNQNQRDW